MNRVNRSPITTNAPARSPVPSDLRSKLRVMFSVDFKELRSYSVWEQSELRARGLGFQSQRLQPPMFLLLLVSYPQAVAAQTLLLKMSGQQRTQTLGETARQKKRQKTMHKSGV